MLLKTKNLKYTIKLSLCLLAIQAMTAQEPQPQGQGLSTDSLSVDVPAPVVSSVNDAEKTAVEKDSVKPFKKFKVDGVAGVVGDYLILESDIDQFLFEIKSQGQAGNVTPCQVLGNLLESKLLAHQAVQDSVVVQPARINGEVDQMLASFVQQLGSEQKVVEFYKKDNVADLREELYSIRRDRVLAERMNEKIIADVDVTPDEIRSFYESIPEEEVPTVGVELEISQIVIEPKATEEAKQKVIDRLKGFKSDILDNGSSFATKAVLYSDDAASRPEGGMMVIDRKTPLVKEFRDVVFTLQEGEVSDPFETEYGFHIATLERTKGDKLEIRHILLIPEVTKDDEEKAQDLIKLVRKRIMDGELTFADAAKEFSDQKETKFDGGRLTIPQTGESRFELVNLDPLIYPRVSNLKEGEISLVFNDPSRTGKARYTIMTVTKRFEEHKADYIQDYVKIKDLALREKQIKAIEKWQKGKIIETYIKVNGTNRDCDFVSNWLKK